MQYSAGRAAYFLDSFPQCGSNWEMLALIVKAPQASTCGLARVAYG